MKRKDTVVVAVRIERKLADDLTRLAKKYRRTRNNYLALVIADIVERGSIAPKEFADAMLEARKR